MGIFINNKNNKRVIRRSNSTGKIYIKYVTATPVVYEQALNDSSFSSVSLLMHMNGSNNSSSFTDSSFNPKTITNNGPVISTSQSKFGGASGYFSNNYRTGPYTSDFDLTGNFTLECWFNSVSFSSGTVLISKDTYGSNYDWSIYMPNSTTMALYTNGTNSNLTVTVPAMSTNTWHHVAFVRNNGTNTIYLNGVAYGSNSMSITNASQTKITIGCASWNNPGIFFNGYINELRLSKVARYTSNFTPQTTQFLDNNDVVISSVTGFDSGANIVLSNINSQSSVTDYLIQYSSDAGSSWTTFNHAASSSQNINITGLTNGNTYTFRVAPITSSVLRFGPSSSSVLVNVATVPDAPSSLAGTSFSSNSAALAWVAPNNNRSAITDYVVQYSTDNSNWTTFNDGTSTSTSASVTGLTNGTLYYFRVAATNSVGTGSYSSSISGTPNAGIILSANTTPRALVGGGVNYNPTFINSSYRSCFNFDCSVNSTKFKTAYYASNPNIPVSKLFSNKLPYQNAASSDYYFVYLGHSAGSTNIPIYFYFNIPTTLTSYRLWNAFASGASWSTDTPKAWVVEGSNDDINWTSVDTRTNQSALPYATSSKASNSPYSEFSISSPSSYKTYRLRITQGRNSYGCDKGGCDYYVQIGEIQLLGYESPSSQFAFHGYNTLLPTARYYDSNKNEVSNSFEDNYPRKETYIKGAFSLYGTLLTRPSNSSFNLWNIPSTRVGSTAKTGYFGFDYPVTINSYKMWTSGVRSWILYGSNDFSSWTTLDTRTSVSTGGSSFSVASPSGYKYYKMSITDSSSRISDKSGTNYSGTVNDIQLFGTIT
jgi:hypothetical protein